MLKLFVGLALACLVTPAVAASDCADQASRLLTAAAKDKTPVVANFRVAAEPWDREIIIAMPGGAQAIWLFAKGCLTGPPVVLAPEVADPAPAAPEPASKPRGAGAEISS